MPTAQRLMTIIISETQKIADFPHTRLRRRALVYEVTRTLIDEIEKILTHVYGYVETDWQC